MEIRIAVNADDYGLTDGVCEAINELAEVNAITNTTMMLCADDAINRINRKATRKVRDIAGVHLQLTGGSPLSQASSLPSLVSPDGCFSDPRGRVVNIEEVAQEWQFQIETFIELFGKLPTHIDSHHGMHRESNFFPVYVSLAKKYGVPFRGANDGVRESIVKENLSGSTALVRDWTGSCSGAAGLLSSLSALQEKFPDVGFFEVISHPGFPDEKLRKISSFNQKRICDYQALLEISKSDIFSEFRTKMKGFEQVFSDG